MVATLFIACRHCSELVGLIVFDVFIWIPAMGNKQYTFGYVGMVCSIYMTGLFSQHSVVTDIQYARACVQTRLIIQVWNNAVQNLIVSSPSLLQTLAVRCINRELRHCLDVCLPPLCRPPGRNPGNGTGHTLPHRASHKRHIETDLHLQSGYEVNYLHLCLLTLS